MKNLIAIILSIGFGTMMAQLPLEMYYSLDGKTLYTGGINPTGLYDNLEVKDVYLDFSQSNYWTQLTNNYDSETLILATMTYNGDVYDSIGVRFRGNTSYMQIGSSEKKSFKVEMDFIDGSQDLFGYENLKFNNAHQDPSFMREVLYCNMANKYIPIAKANYIHLYLNNISWGIYPNIQSTDKTFLKQWFLSNNGINFRANSPGGGGPGGGGGGPSWGDGTAALNNLGTDTTLYQSKYTLKTSGIENPWQKLVDVCITLENASEANITETLTKIDIDKALWFLAVENIFTDDDSYIMKGKMDYLVHYEAETGRTTPMEYDGNSTFVIDDATSSNWGPFKNTSNQNYPLLNILLNIPEWRQRYLAHYRTILEETFTTDNTAALVNQFDELIATEVANDTKKLYSTAQYTSQVPQLISFVTNRRNYLLSNAEVGQEAPLISSAPYYNSNMSEYEQPIPNEIVNIKTTIEPEIETSNVFLYYATGLVGNFTKTLMYDDGVHNDNSSGDGIFGASIPGYTAGETVRYYVEAIANNSAASASYLPIGAEHDVFVYSVIPSTPEAANGVVINEVMASNSSTITDEDGQYEDWIELYNTNNYSVDLSNFYLSDNTNDLGRWQVPSGTSIEANSYLIFWCDKDTIDGPLHTNFKLSSDGESVTLSNNDQAIVDQVFFSAQIDDMSYARIPNGTGPFLIQAPTFNYLNNQTPINIEELENENAFILYPNPTTNYVRLEFGKIPESEKIVIYSYFGELIFETTSKQNIQIDVSAYNEGIYIIKCGNSYQKLVVN